MREELIILGMAALPVVELRGAIPLALHLFQWSPLRAMFWSMLGNYLPVIVLLWSLPLIARWLAAHLPWGHRWWQWLCLRTETRHAPRFRRWGALALVFFVAVPLPFTGAWTGALAAYLFGVPKRWALFLIGVGITLAALLVTAVALGILPALQFLL
jgi:uncharacterized membrane protein